MRITNLDRLIPHHFGIVLLLLCNFGCAEKRCTGTPNPCWWLNRKRCEQVRGCSIRPPSCDSANSPCLSRGDEAACGSSSGACFWSDAGCVSRCTEFTNEATCREQNCDWLECEGEAKPCEEHDECPTSLGCTLESTTWCCG
jgi:hypothetical protein